MSRSLQNVVFVDGVRTPFGRAGSVFGETRADDLVVALIRELMRRNPAYPPAGSTTSRSLRPHRPATRV
jgi:acetyl-CoA acyltransferase